MTATLAIVMTVAAWHYRDQRNQIAEQRNAISRAEEKTQLQLFEALYARARAGRFSRRAGQRFDSLDALDQGAAIGRVLKLDPERFDKLRDEAIACMALPDLKSTGKVITRPPDVMYAAFDPAMIRYALRFRDGKISVLRVADDQEIARFQGRGDRDIWTFGFSPDGRYLVTTHSPRGALTVYDIDRHADAVNDPGPIELAARFSPDSRRLALGRKVGKSSSTTWRPVGSLGAGP